MKINQRLRPFFSYYGSKWRIAPKYPQPRFDTLIEPFCGSACYSLCYPGKNVELYDTYEPIVGVWDFLINCSEQDILNIPSDFQNIDELNISKEAKYLVGFNLNPASQMPKKTFSPWRRDNCQFWGDKKKDLIIRQKPFIKHWKCELISYDKLSNTEATYFIDPPYQGKSGGLYIKHDIDYNQLENWVKNLNGQFICCEMEGAKWGDFENFTVAQVNPSSKGRKNLQELIWHN